MMNEITNMQFDVQGFVRFLNENPWNKLLFLAGAIYYLWVIIHLARNKKILLGKFYSWAMVELWFPFRLAIILFITYIVVYNLFPRSMIFQSAAYLLVFLLALFNKDKNSAEQP